MNTLKVKISGDNSLLAQFVLQHAASGSREITYNVKEASFSTKENEKYILLVEVVGPSGQKYKLVIEGAQKATYPTGEQTMDDSRDFLLARITA